MWRRDTHASARVARGCFLPPSQFEAMFVSLAHQQRDLEQTIEAAEAAFGRRTKNREPGT